MKINIANIIWFSFYKIILLGELFLPHPVFVTNLKEIGKTVWY